MNYRRNAKVIIKQLCITLADYNHRASLSDCLTAGFAAALRLPDLACLCLTRPGLSRRLCRFLSGLLHSRLEYFLVSLPAWSHHAALSGSLSVCCLLTTCNTSRLRAVTALPPPSPPVAPVFLTVFLVGSSSLSSSRSALLPSSLSHCMLHASPYVSLPITWHVLLPLLRYLSSL